MESLMISEILTQFILLPPAKFLLITNGKRVHTSSGWYHISSERTQHHFHDILDRDV